MQLMEQVVNVGFLQDFSMNNTDHVLGFSEHQILQTLPVFEC